jgi:hypothetical protein
MGEQAAIYYRDLVIRCHLAVAEYLENHPKESQLFHTAGYLYYDILRITSLDLDRELSIWCANYWAAGGDFRERLNNYHERRDER